MTTQTAALTAKARNYIADPTARVRELNDNFRRDIFNRNLGTLIITAGVAAMKDEDRFALVREVQCFEDFNEGNDPYGEHEFGAIDFHKEKYFFKIDYYDKNNRFHSKNKASSLLTNRVLTIMQACEY
jgi:hypothetical protein